MGHDVAIKVMLNAEEYVAFRSVCEEQGISQSGLARQLIKKAIREYATALRDAPANATDQTAPE